VTALPSPTAPLKIANHLIFAFAIAVIVPFTGFAWPFAVLTGIVIGKAEADRSRGIVPSAGVRLIQFAAVTGGVLTMIFAGAVIGGLIAFLISALAVFSERVAADASAMDRAVARILLFAAALLGWILLSVALGMRLDLRVGS